MHDFPDEAVPWASATAAAPADQLLRDPRPAASPPAKLRRRPQLRQAAQNPQGPNPIRIYLQSLDFRATQIQNQPAPANAGTKHLVGPDK